MCFKPSMIYYTWILSNIPFFNIIPNGTKTYSHEKQVMLYNTFIIHENATLPLFIPKYMGFLRKKFKLYSFNDQNHI
jgi:hypothetical protein